MIGALLSVYRPSFPRVLVYMLQSTEYHAKPYLSWLWRTQNFSLVMQRRTLDPTKAARMLLLALRVGIAVQIAAGVSLLVLGLSGQVFAGVPFGLALIFGYPVVWGHLAVLPMELGRLLISRPAERRLIAESRRIFANHQGIKIAVAGSYGKTSMKELLLTVLSEGLDVAATPANKNVSSSHAYFARKLSGKEDVLIIE
ncbi:MAG: hypothetical protein ABIV43_03880 [Candidatus Saccharimonadales bacterium]